MCIEELTDLLTPGLLPAAVGVRCGDQFDAGTVRGEHPVHDRFQSRVGDEGDGVVMGDPGQGQTQAEGSAGGFDDHRAGSEVAAGLGFFDHVQRGAVFHPTGIAAFEFRPEAAAVAT